ncbi:MAG: DUF1501 domain-containing protein [Reyranellaceae bacterium]
MLKRRQFLSLAGGVSALLAARPALAGPPAAGPNWDRVLVLVELKGGNDGMNTVIPYAEPLYGRLRPNLGLERGQVVQLTPELGLNPALQPLLESWRAGDLGIVLGVGYPDPNRSHFRSIEIWDTASASDQYLSEGWIARAFEGNPRPASFALDTVVVDDNTLPVSGPGLRNVVLRDVENFIQQAERMQQAAADRGGNPALRHLLKVQGEVHRAAFTLRDRMRNAPAPAVEMPATPFGRQLDLALRLLLSRLPLAAIKIGLGGFDTHARQRDVHDRLLGALGDGLARFRTALMQAGLWDRVLVMTYSEFGRRVAENGSRGTDHGTAAAHFAMGGRVKGGFHGRQPPLHDLREGDVKHTVDFRDVFATVTQRWWSLRPPPGARRQLLDFV